MPCREKAALEACARACLVSQKTAWKSTPESFAGSSLPPGERGSPDRSVTNVQRTAVRARPARRLHVSRLMSMVVARLIIVWLTSFLGTFHEARHLGDQLLLADSRGADRPHGVAHRADRGRGGARQHLDHGPLLPDPDQ